jgi:hypothetical protein
MQSLPEPVLDRNLPPKGHPWGRWFQGLLYFIAYCAIAVFCLLWAMGYRVNWAAATIQQTGVLELSSPQAGLNPEVYINGQLHEQTLPVRLRWVLPGRYDVEIKKEGYQSWSRQVVVHPNERVSFPSILLLFEAPREITPPNLRLDELEARVPTTRNIEIRFQNELWIRDEFVTRSSQDILQAEWYDEGKFVIYQAGNALLLRNIETGVSQLVAEFEPEIQTPVPYVLRENRRVLVFAEGEKLRAFELYAPRTILDRFAPRN